MATYCPEDLASRELSCPICFEDYDIHDDKRSPKLLLCLHTFCLDCTSKLWKSDGSIECSLCRMLHEGVRLEDLLDNHVIVQHLRRECEKQDLELARRIDQELRDLDSLAPAGPSDITEIKAMFEKKTFDTPDIPEVVNISSEQEQEEEEEEEDPEDQEENRHYILTNFLEEFMEGLNSPRMHINPESEDNEEDSDDRDDDDDENSEEHEDIQEVEAREEENDGDPEEEDATNPFYSLHNIHSLLEEAEEENTGDIFEVGDIQTILNMTENEENDAEDDEDEDERWHSASDELNVACWTNHENLQLDDVNEMEDDTPEIFDWHIINSESLLDD